MKRKLFLLSSIALLGITMSTSACAGPGISIAPSSSQTDTSETTTSSQTESAPEVTITLTAAKTALTVGEKTALTHVVTNNTANKAVTYSTSDATIVELTTTDGVTYARALKKGTAKVTAKCCEKSASVTLTVTGKETLKAEAYTKLTTALTGAAEKESTQLKSGTLNQVIKNNTDAVTRDDIWGFEVYSDSKIKTTYEARGAYKEKATTQYGINGESLVIYKTEEANNEVTVSADSKTIPFGETTISKADAEKYMKAVDIDATGDPSKAGIINKIIKEKITGNTAITGEVGKESLKLVNDELNVYKLTGEGKFGTATIEFSIDYKLDENGALTYLKYAQTKYLTSTGTKTKNSSEEITLNLTNETRQAAGDTYINFDSLYYTDYVPALIDDMGDAITSGAVGTGASVEVVSGAPLTACKEVDHLTVTKIEPAERAELDETGNLYFLAPGEVTITTKSIKGVEKTLTIQVEKAPITYLGVLGLDAPLNINTDNPISFEIYPETALATAEFTYTVVNEGECDAAITKTTEGAETFYTIKATKPGTATVTFTEPTYKDENGELIARSYEVTFVDPEAGGETTAPTPTITTPIEAATYIANSKWSDGTDSGNNYTFFQLDEGTPSTNFTFSINGGFDLIRGSVTISGNATEGFQFDVSNLNNTQTQVKAINFGWKSETEVDFTKLEIALDGDSITLTCVAAPQTDETVLDAISIATSLTEKVWLKDGMSSMNNVFSFSQTDDEWKTTATGSFDFNFFEMRSKGTYEIIVESGVVTINVTNSAENTGAGTFKVTSMQFGLGEVGQDLNQLVVTCDDGSADGPFQVYLMANVE